MFCRSDGIGLKSVSKVEPKELFYGISINTLLTHTNMKYVHTPAHLEVGCALQRHIEPAECLPLVYERQDNNGCHHLLHTKVNTRVDIKVKTGGKIREISGWDEGGQLAPQRRAWSKTLLITSQE